MPRIMIVDDEPDIVDCLQALGPRHGWTTAGFSRARDALAAFRADPSAFDCVATDIFMPDMDGIELIQALRAIHRTIPIIALSGRRFGSGARSFPLGAATALGADAGLVKPFDSRELFETAASLLTRKRPATCGDGECQPA